MHPQVHLFNSCCTKIKTTIGRKLYCCYTHTQRERENTFMAFTSQNILSIANMKPAKKTNYEILIYLQLLRYPELNFVIFSISMCSHVNEHESLLTLNSVELKILRCTCRSPLHELW